MSTESLDRLEEKLKVLLGRMDALREENRSFRMAAGSGPGVSGNEALEEINRLRREKTQLQEKLDTVEKRVSALIEKLEQVTDSR